MSKAFSNNHNATVRRLSAGIADYSERRLAIQEKPVQGVVHYESLQALRESAGKLELAEAYWQAELDCGAMRTRAMWSAYRHNCYCKAREVVARVPVIVAHSLRQVSAQLIALARSVSPPGLMTAPNILATCHASNAPGLPRIAMTYGRRYQTE